MSYSVGTLKGKKIAFQNLFETIQWFMVFLWSVFRVSVHLDVLIFICTWK